MPNPEQIGKESLIRNDGRLLVMGDIHGQFEKIQRVLAVCRYNPNEDQLILLGDYVDRGPESCKVVEAVMNLVEEGAVALYGNHEDMMVRALAGQNNERQKSLDIEQWFANGGEITLSSYRAKASLLKEHLTFFKKMPRWHAEGGFLFVHAGIRAGYAIERQSPHDLIWIREDYILGYKGFQPVVAGHTPTQYLKRYELYPDIEDASKPVIRENKYFLDTGVAWGGPLTIMDMRSIEFWQAL